MANEPKTRKTRASVAAFLDRIPDAGRREDCKAVAAMMRKASGRAPKMWGTGIVALSILASLLPAQSAARLTIRDTLVYEG